MGIRVIKTALAALTAIYIAQLMGLPSSLSAGLLAILGVETTRLKGLRSSFVRIAASVTGLILATAIFSLLGFHIWTLSLYILITFPILARAGLSEGIVTCSVMVFHVFAQGEVSGLIIWNEVVLLVIGLGTATIYNVAYMPREDRRIMQIRNTTEELFSAIFLQIARHLRDNTYVWSGEEVLQAESALEEGLQTAKRMEENRLWRAEGSPVIYFMMRRQQLDCIQRMLDLVAQVYQTLPHGMLAAELFEELSVDLKSKFYTGNVEKHLAALEAEFKLMELPATRDEFEVRSALLQLCLELRHYLVIAKQKKPRISLSPENA
ncbi:membrane protein [Paenibacillus swuensis]|uniref:Membrane protein n=1 Tax=Paenibacillus swuensis TaxID=1178515 RepID=A0A172TLI2_9BACL|nr:aromatic acid exporter family protein [Paenibacillus swuensis]ANE47890.1 membrane protein [Paenibacillus swuensis]